MVAAPDWREVMDGMDNAVADELRIWAQDWSAAFYAMFAESFGAERDDY